jgi:1,2-phenylacetyl-CoA epoxidase catalytic subunit
MGVEKSFMSIKTDDPKKVRKMVHIRLKQGLYNELRVAEVSAAWIPNAPLKAQHLLARQVDDEFRHVRWVTARLKEIGDDNPWDWEPLQAYQDLFDFFMDCTPWDITERVMMNNYTEETVLAYWANVAFVDVIEPIDARTAAVYRKIQKDEVFHSRLGRVILEEFATTEEKQEKAEAARLKVLEIMRRIVPEWRERLAREL